MSGLLGYLSPLLTAASEGVAANNEGKEQGNKLLRAIYAQNVANEERESQTQKNRADASALRRESRPWQAIPRRSSRHRASP
jgi:hypothetical protein